MSGLFLALLLGWFGGDVLVPGPVPTDNTAAVHIKNFAFDPATLTVAAGTTVRFVNDDSEAHTVTARDRSFDSSGLDTHDAWSFRFTKTGTFAYFCELHPYMKGVIIVQ
jgi:plastocyanin